MLFRLLILILFLALPASWAGATQDVWTGVEKIVAVGDVHGDYKQFVILLEEAGLIDQKQKWIGGKAHLVQTGDVLDRGPDSRQVMDLLMDLEKQARKAGGYVHALIGNHEAMNIYGDLRYVTPEEYEAFRDRNSERIRERHPLGYFEHRFQFGPNGKYGDWIRGHNAVIKINDILFLHGGISPKHVNDSIRRINETVREELKDFSRLEGGIVMDEEGPLWYRGLALVAEESLTPHLEMLFSNYDSRRIVIGHTVTRGAVMPRLGGRVVLIDVGLSAFYGARLACLIIEKDRTYALHRGRKLELPSDSGSSLLDYLKQATALDPPPSPLESIIQRIEEKLAVPANR